MIRPVVEAYKIENSTVPVLAVRKNEQTPFGFTIREITSEPRKMYEHQLFNIEQTNRYGSDWIPYLKPWHGVGIYADAFGSTTTWPENDYPWTEPFIEDISDVYDLKAKKPGHSGLMEKVLDTIRRFKEWSMGELPIAITDTQSPFNTASLIIKPDALLMGCYVDPNAVHYLLSMITDLIIDFSRQQFKEIGEGIALPGHLFPAGAENGISVSDDNNTMISPDMYDRFILPYMNRISEAFNGIYIHSCGNFVHNLESWMKVKNLLGINIHIGEGDMDPYSVKEKKTGGCTVWADVGMKWQLVHSRIETFYEKYYLDGLLGEGNIRGVMVEAVKSDDPVEQKELVAWTREKITEMIGR